MSVNAAHRPANGPALLALDTATERLHAALVVGDAAPRVIDLPGGAQASATLLPALSALVSDAGLAWADLDALAFGAGPGAFTGLRTACATVQGLALGLNKPVLALDTLMAVAEDARLAHLANVGGVADVDANASVDAAWASASAPLWALQDARMGELYAASYRWDGQRWHADQAPQLWPLAHALSQAPACWAGNALQADAALLAPLQVSQQPGTQGPVAAPRGAALASLARQAWARGEAIDAALALPRYVRDKVAQTTAERQQARA